MLRRFAVVLILMSLFSLAGCFDDDPVAPEDQQPLQALQAATKEELLTLFGEAYGEMNLDDYTDLLHEDFEFQFMTYKGAVTGKLTREAELQCAANMFSGEPHSGTGGRMIGAISSINFKKLDIRFWEDLEPGDTLLTSYPGTMGGLYDVELIFYYDDPDTGNTSSYTVKGFQYFLVTPVTLADDRVIWKLLRHRDEASFGFHKNEEVTWSGVKLLYL